MLSHHLLTLQGFSSLAPPETECFNWANEDSPASCRKALTDLDSYLKSTDPFDGVMAFSSGAALAASFLIAKAREDPTRQVLHPVFRCVIFLSGGVPATFEEKRTVLVNVESSGELVGIPTLHIWGANDRQYPNFGPVIYKLCAAEFRDCFVHGGGHEVPGSKDSAAVKETVRVINATIQKATM